ncbi:MAG: metal ABC transporter ATP-binding protein [Nitrospira sp.]|nr:metal ABC transporter ATP-binding protein [Candidatus Manganitrophaceae bacterium]HIL35239.1 metal ABC transporter ATP-binding protein [Candidatus Manganitrophaceae bacterium]
MTVNRLAQELSPEPGKSLVSLSNVTCGYHNRVVFQNLSLQIFPRQFAGLVGPSGAGKSTLLKVILGVVPVLSGTVKVSDRFIDGNQTPHIGYVPQIETVDWDFPVTVEQVVAMGLYRQSRRLPWLTRKERKRIKDLLEELGIGSYAHRQIKALSGGEQQRVFLARALVGDPELLILDEPTSGVDLKTQHAILHLLGELNRRGVTILLTTHDLNAVARHLPWVICFNKKVIAQGDPEEVFTAPILSRTYDSEMSVIRHGDVILIDDSPKAGLHFKRHQHAPEDRRPGGRGQAK